MGFLDIVKKRKTTYEFKEKQIPKAAIAKILEAGRWAASSLNSQPWTFILIKDKKMISDMLDICYYGAFYSQPVVMIVVVAEPISLDKKALLRGKAQEFVESHKYMNIGFTVSNMVHMAQELSIDSCILSPIVKDANRMLSIPEEKEAILAIGLGYEKKDAYSKPRSRKALKDILRYETYNGNR